MSSPASGVFFVCAYAVPLGGWLRGYLPAGCLLLLGILLLALSPLRGVMQPAEDTPSLEPARGWNVAVNLLIPPLMAVGMPFWR